MVSQHVLVELTKLESTTRNQGLIAGLIKGNRKPMVNKPLIRPAISWGKRSFGGAARIPLIIGLILTKTGVLLRIELT